VHLGVDTGAPVTVVAPTAPDVTFGLDTVMSLKVGTKEFDNVMLVGEAIAQGTPLDGVLGCTVICPLEVSFNYRDREFTMGNPAIPANVEDPAHEIDFMKLYGGMNLGIISSPASRILVTASVEGTNHTLLVDTGAFAIALRQNIFNGIVADGRGKLGLTSITAQGQADSTLARLRTLSVNGVSVSGPIAASSMAFDNLLNGVSMETGQTVDGTVGAPFLHEFFVSVDYPNNKLRLRRYATRDHIVDLAIRVGFFTGAPSGNGLSVQAVAPMSDAANQGVKMGDVILAIDGMAVASLQPDVLLHLLSGPVGSTHAIDFACTNCMSGKTTKTIKVEDLLPLP
jgi:hypothetical protein